MCTSSCGSLPENLKGSIRCLVELASAASRCLGRRSHRWWGPSSRRWLSISTRGRVPSLVLSTAGTHGASLCSMLRSWKELVAGLTRLSAWSPPEGPGVSRSRASKGPFAKPLEGTSLGGFRPRSSFCRRSTATTVSKLFAQAMFRPRRFQCVQIRGRTNGVIRALRSLLQGARESL